MVIAQLGSSWRNAFEEKLVRGYSLQLPFQFISAEKRELCNIFFESMYIKRFGWKFKGFPTLFDTRVI